MPFPHPPPPLSCHVVLSDWSDQVTIKTQGKLYAFNSALILFFNFYTIKYKNVIHGYDPKDNHTKYILAMSLWSLV